jgi:hypothetical protein
VTPIEAIVIILLMLFVAALLLPAQVGNIDHGRGNGCRNNLRQLAIGLFQYANKTSANELPGYVNALERADKFAVHDPRTRRVEPVSWVVMILPELDRQALYELWQRGDSPRETTRIGTPPAEVTSVYLEFLVCPSDPQPSRSGTPICYAVNAGIPDYRDGLNGGTAAPGLLPPRGTNCRCAACDPTAATAGGETLLPARDRLANGLFFDAFTSSKHFDPRTRHTPVVSSYATIADPKEKTILLTENVDAMDYTFFAWSPDGSAFAESYPWAERRSTVTWSPDSTLDEAEGAVTMTPPSKTYGINIDAGTGNGRSYAHARPSSKHPGGFNAAFAGSQVLFLKDKISYYVYAKLMASHDAAAGAVDDAGGVRLMPEAFRTAKLTEEEVNP